MCESEQRAVLEDNMCNLEYTQLCLSVICVNNFYTQEQSAPLALDWN